jgi:hypothetical protein
MARAVLPRRPDTEARAGFRQPGSSRHWKSTAPFTDFRSRTPLRAGRRRHPMGSSLRSRARVSSRISPPPRHRETRSPTSSPPGATARPKARAVALAVSAELPLRRGLMKDFLELLPQGHAGGERRCAARHDERVEGLGLDTHGCRSGRCGMRSKIRHESFRDPAFVDLLRDHDVALVCADTVEWPRLMDLTSDFVYCRLHGSAELYRSRYEEGGSRALGGRVEAWARGTTDARRRIRWRRRKPRAPSHATCSCSSTIPTSSTRPMTLKS